MRELSEPLSIDTIIDTAIELCNRLPETPGYSVQARNIRDLRERLAGGRLHIAVLGQFNRGKSTFINVLLGMEILPASVLPITSVPTVISFGSVNQCLISFSDGKEDVVAEGAPDTIRELLLRYATEENNPKNNLHVAEAIVRCESQLLAHGTVIIDTPGFGSTHTHNTRTTLELLASCDAALFLLSADLPITQVEIDFLKNVMATVPRLFFIYNKIDLLSDNELEITRRFIRDTLVKQFGFTLDVRLFPVSSKTVKDARYSRNTFEKSGFASVEKEIIDFLLREKYFTLSEALTGKFKDALAAIIASLEKSKADITTPLQALQEQIATMQTLKDAMEQEMGKARQLSGVEETALQEHCDTLAKKKRGELRTAVIDHLNNLIDSVSAGKHDAILTSVFTRLFEEIFNRLFMFCITEQKKPLKNAAMAHIRELNKLKKRVESALASSFNPEQSFTCAVDIVEIDELPEWKPDIILSLKPPCPSLRDRFSRNEKQRQRLFEHYAPQVLIAADNGLEMLIEKINALIQPVFSEFIHRCIDDYILLLNMVQEKLTSLEQEHASLHTQSQPLLAKLTALCNGFHEVKKQLV